MIDVAATYPGTVLAWLLAGVLVLIQLLVADVAGLRAGKAPGVPVAGGHDQFLFRATRAFDNTRESLGLFVLFTLVCVAGGAEAPWVNGLALAWVGARAAHALCYWCDWRSARSIAFIVSLIALGGLAVLGLLAL